MALRPVQVNIKALDHSAVGGLAVASPAAAGGRCVDTPSEYQAAWQARQVRCVAPTLFGTTHGRGDGSLYPAGFAYAWAGSSVNLEAYLRLRRRYGDEPAKVGVGILSQHHVLASGLAVLERPVADGESCVADQFPRLVLGLADQVGHLHVVGW